MATPMDLKTRAQVEQELSVLWELNRQLKEHNDKLKRELAAVLERERLLIESQIGMR